MSRFKSLYFVIFIINLYKINAQISDKRLCADEKCEVPISQAKTLLRYSSPDSRILSFAPNVDITIYSKSAGSREDLWGGEINGKRGYIPRHMVRETKVLQKPTLLVDTEFNNETETKQVPSKLEPDKVQEPYEVIDGTTIYLSPQENISPSSTDSSVQSTALPAGTDKIKDKEQEQTKKEDQPEEAAKSGENLQSSEKKDENVDNSETPAVTETDPQTEEEGDDDDDDAEEEDDEIDIDGDEEDEESEEQDVVETQPQAEATASTTQSGVQLSADVTKEKEESDSVTDPIPSQEEATAAVTEKKEPDNVTDPTLSNEASNENLKAETISSEEQKENAEAETVSSKESEIEDSNLNSDETVSESTESNILSSPEPEEVVDETTVPPTIEATTLSPEIEVPQPFDDSFIEVTPNPLEEPNKVEDIISSLPPFSLFAGSTPDSSATLGSKSEETIEKNLDIESEDITEEKQELENTSIVNNEPQPTVIPGEEVKLEEPQPSVISDEEVELEEPQLSVIPNEEVKLEEPQPTIIPDEEVKLEETEEVKDVIEDESTVYEGDAGPGLIGNIMSFFGMGSQPAEAEETLTYGQVAENVENGNLLSTSDKESYCDAPSCEANETQSITGMDIFNFNPDVLLYLVTTAVSVIIFLFGYIAFDKSKREGPLIAKINSLEKQLLIVVKENQILQETVSTESGYETNDRVPNEVVENLKQELADVTNLKNAYEEQVQSLEKELENSTEVGMELNKMLSEILSSENGSDIIKSNVENMQRQLVEQQSTINSVNETLAITNTENHELRLEVELSNKKVLDLQAELDKLLLNVLKIEEEKETQQSTLENEVTNYREKYEEIYNKLRLKEEEYNSEMKQLNNRVEQTERKLELKIKEHDVLIETLKQLKTVKNSDESALQNLLEVTGIKAEVQLLNTENQRLSEKLQQEQELKSNYEKKAQSTIEEIQVLKEKYDDADKLRVETQTKLEVLSNYFKDREAQWQKEISKHEALWAEREGEATSTTERIKFMQDQLQNYKAQTESLKQEIMNQEIELKSQISVLEKKAHENWVSARQAERKLEEAKQEAAQLRHRLTLRERAMHEEKNQHRLQSPIEQNGDMPVSPMESPASPPLLYGARDHITKSPPLPGLPPFLPPPPGVPFMPPPIHGVPPFIPPPPPNMFPGDHRPPPLGRMSSPPLNSRYSPSSRGYSPYDRNSSSPSDSEYGTSPPHRRAYSPFNSREDRRDYKRPPPGRSNGRNIIKGGGSSGSGNSNESLEKINRQQSKV